MKNINRLVRGISPHWVGDGFPVRSVITPKNGRALGPFILMDYAGPETFKPGLHPKGVDVHPHKGFETVTVVFQGELEHRDSAGNKGKIGSGDVQWMTAGSGVLHEEKHSKKFTRSGGALEMAQIWVNLPAKDKSATPGYQTILASDIKAVPLPEGPGHVRVIAGEYLGSTGPARTFTPVNLWLVQIDTPNEVNLPIPEGQAGGIYVRKGSIQVEGETVTESELLVFDQEGSGIIVTSTGPTDLLVLAGDPIYEPMVAYGPFVMNSQDEIFEAIQEFKSGKYGEIV